MRKTKRTSDLIPAFFMGAPFGLIAAGIGANFAPAGLSLAAGAIAGQVLGLALVRALRRG